MGLEDIGGIGSLLGGGGGLTSLFGGGGDPIASLIDEVGGALGLPKELTGAAKIGAAIYTGDVICGVSGGMDLMQGLSQDSQGGQSSPASTECPGSDSCTGYAAETDPKTGDRDDWSPAGKSGPGPDDLQVSRERNGIDAKGFNSSAESSRNRTDDVSAMVAQGMDIETVVETVLSKCLDKMDQDIEKESADISSESKKSTSASKGAGASAQTGAKGAAGTSGSKDASGTDSSNGATSPSLQEMQTKLQDLVQKRQQLYSLMTGISSDFNEASKQILANMGKA